MTYKGKPNKYPVGATWEGDEVDPRLDCGCFQNKHRSCRVWLKERYENGEIWQWEWYYGDESRGGFDWATSYGMCKDSIPFECRLKRVV